MRHTQKGLQVLSALLQSLPRPLAGSDLSKRTGIGPGTIYPMLARFQAAGWLTSEWEQLSPAEQGRPRKRFYTLTGRGQVESRAALAEVQLHHQFRRNSMGLIISVSGLLLAGIALLLPGLVNGLLMDALPSISTWLVMHAARRTAPTDRQEFEEEWLAGLASYDTKAQKTLWAIGCYKASLIIEPPLMLRLYKLGLWAHRKCFVASANCVGLYCMLRPRLNGVSGRIAMSIASRNLEALEYHFIEHRRALVGVCLRQQSNFDDPERGVRELVRLQR